MSENSNTINISTKSTEMVIGEGESGFSIDTPKIVGNKDHSKMKNLDFESSGHTGFASSKDIEEINNELKNYVKDENYVHTDNNYTDEDKEKLENLENMSGKASDISYEDNTGQGVDNVQDGLDEAFRQIEGINNGFNNIDADNIHYKDEYEYGTPDKLGKALNFAFEEIDGRMTYSDVSNNFVNYNANQTLTNTQKQRARNNIGIPQSCIMYSQVQNLTEGNKNIARHNIGVRGFTDLGEIDLADYDDDVGTFIDTLTEEGTYKFVDNSDYFTWVVETWWLGDYSLGQKYCYTEEGFTYQYYRNGYYDEDNDEFSWEDWTYYMTDATASQMFASRSHSHISTLTTPYDIRGYLDKITNYNLKDLRVTSSTNKHLYIVKVDYTNYNPVGGGTRYVRYQEYFDIEEPNKIYKRTGLDTRSTTSNVTWGDWYVFEGVAE